MEWDRQEVAPVEEEAPVEVPAAAAGWEARVPVPDPAGDVFARSAAREHPIR